MTAAARAPRAATVTPITAPIRRPRILNAIVLVGCDLLALGGEAVTAYARARHHDARHDQRLIRARALAGRGAQVAAVVGCGCDRRFASISAEVGEAQLEDAAEDGWLAVCAVNVWKICGIVRGLNVSLERELGKRGTGR